VIEVFYHHPLALRFTSAQTIQVVQDYAALSARDVAVTVYGEYRSKAQLSECIDAGKSLNWLYHRPGKLKRLMTKVKFFFRIMNSAHPIVVTRSLRKAKTLFFLSKIKPSIVHVHEMHETSFDYLFKNTISKDKFLKQIERCDGIIFTNRSQHGFFLAELGSEPNAFCVLPNGVNCELYKDVVSSDKGILTYVGQFNPWKNFELVMAAMAYLPDRYTLRIAGGDGSEQAVRWILNLANHYGVNTDRINYLGYVEHKKIPGEILSGSSVLLLPLGDNIQSDHLTCPMKLIEYLASGIPVVAVRKPTTTGLASENEVFFSDATPAQFANAIEKAANCDSPTRKQKQQLKASQYDFRSRSLNHRDFFEQLLTR